MIGKFIGKWMTCGWLVRLVVIFGVVFSASGAYYVKASGLLSPGPLSASQPHDIELGGVMSHADMEKDCGHCHAPLHCVTDSRCQDCHIEIARDRNDVSTLHGRLPGVTKCATCHIEHQGAEADITELAFQNVDHFLLADYSLAAHVTNYDGSSFNCTSCHIQEGDIQGTLDCVTCHAEEDHEYMADHITEYGMACVECHDGADRMMNDFAHEGSFPLHGAHADATCADCHERTTYVDLSSACADCHEDPEMHLGMFGNACERCHSDVAWAPAELKEHTFMVSHGSEAIQDCETCHAGTYTEYPCYTCHTDEDMRVAHAPHGIVEYQDCISCHPTGRAGEAAAAAPGPGSIAGPAEPPVNGANAPVEQLQPGSPAPEPGPSAGGYHQPGKDGARKSRRDG